MLDILTPAGSHVCDRFTRRNALRIGGLGTLGLSRPTPWQATTTLELSLIGQGWDVRGVALVGDSIHPRFVAKLVEPEAAAAADKQGSAG